jgi:hypothetical protein
MTRSEFLERVNSLHAQFQFSETSGWRTAKRNKMVGGMPTSKHLNGFAVDCVLDDPAHANDFKVAIKAVGLSFLDEKDHIHVQIPPGTKTT